MWPLSLLHHLLVLNISSCSPMMLLARHEFTCYYASLKFFSHLIFLKIWSKPRLKERSCVCEHILEPSLCQQHCKAIVVQL